MGLAMHQFILNHNKRKAEEQEESIIEEKDVPIIRPRLINHEPILQLKTLKVNYYGKLVSIKGTVIKAGHVKVVCQYMAFSCGTCAGTQLVKQVDGVYSLPTSCPTKGCRSESARIPRTLECELTEDLVKSCIPGDDVTITGIIKVRDVHSNYGKNKQHTIFNLYMEAVSINNYKQQNKGSHTISEGITFNMNDYYLIQLAEKEHATDVYTS
ncbi:hypothetical protein NQ318_023107 [Aromia moschata]|uniref:MCM OB domain-containing protein n=1 Tax=Aromia moschata TaxID=1265417 RepID=A0AAV8XF53_9CUCU|nr:hypothetical protein NQ318_023107 [Aromia moschata]